MEYEYHWISKDKTFWSISDSPKMVTVKWSKDIQKDLLYLSESFHSAGYIICEEILTSPRNNIKYDMWFLPGVYLLRHSIELLLKSGLAVLIPNKPTLQDLFISAKHNLINLFNEYIAKKEINLSKSNNLKWVKSYLESIEVIDKNSDLFRYPFKDDFLQQYHKDFLDVADMGNKLLKCYSILLNSITDENMELSLEEEPTFFTFATHGIGNCSLWDSPMSDGFHKQVMGYKEAANFLYKKYINRNDKKIIFPVFFLMRNAIELALKRLLYTKTEYKIPNHIIKRVRNSHYLYKDLWKRIKPLIINYSSSTESENDDLSIVETYIRELNSIDKNGDIFRYPFTFSFEYKFDNKSLDFQNAFLWLKRLFNFFDACDDKLKDICDIENEMRSYDY